MMQTVQIFTITCTTMQHYGEILHPLSWAFECGPTSLHISMEYTQKLTWKENNSGRGKKKQTKQQQHSWMPWGDVFLLCCTSVPLSQFLLEARDHTCS